MFLHSLNEFNAEFKKCLMDAVNFLRSSFLVIVIILIIDIYVSQFYTQIKKMFMHFAYLVSHKKRRQFGFQLKTAQLFCLRA